MLVKQLITLLFRCWLLLSCRILQKTKNRKNAKDGFTSTFQEKLFKASTSLITFQSVMVKFFLFNPGLIYRCNDFNHIQSRNTRHPSTIRCFMSLGWERGGWQDTDWLWRGLARHRFVFLFNRKLLSVKRNAKKIITCTATGPCIEEFKLSKCRSEPLAKVKALLR